MLEIGRCPVLERGKSKPDWGVVEEEGPEDDPVALPLCSTGALEPSLAKVNECRFDGSFAILLGLSPDAGVVSSGPKPSNADLRSELEDNRDILEDRGATSAMFGLKPSAMPKPSAMLNSYSDIAGVEMACSSAKTL